MSKFRTKKLSTSIYAIYWGKRLLFMYEKINADSLSSIESECDELSKQNVDINRHTIKEHFLSLDPTKWRPILKECNFNVCHCGSDLLSDILELHGAYVIAQTCMNCGILEVESGFFHSRAAAESSDHTRNGEFEGDYARQVYGFLRSKNLLDEFHEYSLRESTRI